MLKKFFMAAIVSCIICAGVKVEAASVFVGKSDATDSLLKLRGMRLPYPL